MPADHVARSPVQLESEHGRWTLFTGSSPAIESRFSFVDADVVEVLEWDGWEMRYRSGHGERGRGRHEFELSRSLWAVPLEG